MSMLIHIVVWFLGVVLAIQVVAGFYSVLDFPGKLARYRWTILGRTLGRTGVFVAIYWALPASFGETLVDGLQFLVAVHVLTIFLPNLILAHGRYDGTKSYAKFLADLK